MGEFHTVAKASEVARGDMMLVDVDGEEIVIANVGGEYLGLASQKWRAPTETGGVLWGEESGLRRSSSARRCA